MSLYVSGPSIKGLFTRKEIIALVIVGLIWFTGITLVLRHYGNKAEEKYKNDPRVTHIGKP